MTARHVYPGHCASLTPLSSGRMLSLQLHLRESRCIAIHKPFLGSGLRQVRCPMCVEHAVLPSEAAVTSLPLSPVGLSP